MFLELNKQNSSKINNYNYQRFIIHFDEYANTPVTISNKWRPGSSWLVVSSLTWVPLRWMQPCLKKGEKECTGMTNARLTDFILVIFKSQSRFFHWAFFFLSITELRQRNVEVPAAEGTSSFKREVLDIFKSSNHHFLSQNSRNTWTTIDIPYKQDPVRTTTKTNKFCVYIDSKRKTMTFQVINTCILPVPWFHSGLCRNTKCQHWGQTTGVASFSW